MAKARRSWWTIVMLVALVAACSDESQARIQQEVEQATGQQPATTVAQAVQIPDEELARFSVMLADAMADGDFTAKEQRAFAIEAVECTKRAGFDSTLEQFDPARREITITAAADGPEEGPSDWASEACQNTYLAPVFAAFDGR